MLTNFKNSFTLDFTIHLHRDLCYISVCCSTLRNFCCGHVRISASHWWCSLSYPSLGKRTWYLSILGWRLMVHTAVPCCWLGSCCLSCVRFLASSLSSSKTMLLHTAACEIFSLLEWETSAFISPDNHVASNSPLWARLTTEVGEKCSTGCTRRKFMTSMNWSSIVLY